MNRHPRPLTLEDYVRRIDAGAALKEIAAFALFFGLGALLCLLYFGVGS